ncbi:MAG: tetratricopeptide repeat protein [Planctomycetota bacterium]|nr:tetratricopeptide repeat protein [Planctomycetota bacterium]
MNESLKGAEDKRLVSLEVPACSCGPVRTAATDRVLDEINDRSSASLWIDAPTGTGKTTAVVEALRRAADFEGIKRIACHRGMRIEEALYLLNDFLIQAGIHDMERVLGQRSRLEAKLSVFLNILSRSPVAICFDDFHYLESGCTGDSLESLHSFIKACAGLAAKAPGLMIFTSTSEPPAEAAIRRVQLPGLLPQEKQELWSRLAKAGAVSPLQGHDLEKVDSAPLALQLLCHRDAIAPGGKHPQLNLEDLYLETLALLKPGTRELLELLAEFGRPLGRGALRLLGENLEGRINFPTEITDPRFLELEEYGLVQFSGRETSCRQSCSLHPLANEAAQQGLHDPEPGQVRELLIAAANYYLRLPGSGENIWPMFNARSFLFRAGQYEEASQVQKCFIEDMLRLGYLDLAKKVLTETIETTSGNIRTVSLGNLAIICKNENRYEEALGIYQQVRKEFEESGDPSNLARVLHQIGNIHYLRKDLEAAGRHYEESGRLASELGEDAIWMATRVQLANVLYQCGREEDALKNYAEIVTRLQENPGANQAGLLAAMKVQIGQIHQKAARFLEAESEFSQAEALVRKADDKRSLLKVLRARAMVARQRRAYDEGLSLYGEAEKTAAALGDVLEISTCHLLMGDLERERVQLGAALEKYTSARSLLSSETPQHQLQNTALNKPVNTLIDKRLGELESMMGKESYQRALSSMRRN